jgi:hypothetical protein
VKSCLAVGALFAALLAPTVTRAAASPAERALAVKTFESATRKYDTGRYDEAAMEFQQVFDIVGDPALLYNIAQSWRFAGKPEKAILFYRSYLRRSPDPRNRAEVETRIAELDQQLKHPPPVVQPAPLEDKDKPKPPEKPPESGVVVTPTPTPTPTPLPPPPPKPVDRRPLRIGGYVLVGVGVAALAVGGAMAALTVGASNDVTNAAKTHGEFTSSLRDTESQGNTTQPVSIAMFAIGGAAAVAGAALIVVGFKREAPVRVSTSGTSLFVSGAF